MKYIKLLPDAVATTLMGGTVNETANKPLLIKHTDVIMDRIAAPELAKTFDGVEVIMKVREACRTTIDKKLPYVALEDDWHAKLKKECETNDLSRLPPMYPAIAHNYQPYLGECINATSEMPEDLKALLVQQEN